MFKFLLCQSKTLSGYILLLLFFFMPGANAQKINSRLQDSLVKKYSIKDADGFNNNRHYYLLAGKYNKASTKVIRTLDENFAIVAIGNKAEYDSLNNLTQLVAAINTWKLSPI